MENVTALLNFGLGDILRDLASIGYDAEWHCIRASRYGLPSNRDRIWIIAYPHGSKLEGLDLSQPFLTDPEESCRRELARAVDAALPADDYARMLRDRSRISAVMDELKQYGNSVAPIIPEMIGRAIMEVKE